jgi:hypothetical protein
MTGISTGAKSNLSRKPSTKSDSTPIKKSTISGTSTKSAEKIYYRKMSNGIAKPLKNKASPNKLPSTTSFLSLTTFQANTQFSWKSSKETKTRIKPFGL